MDRELNLNNQILYKLGSIESQVNNVRDDITKVVRRLEERIDDDRAETDRSIAMVKERTDKSLADIESRVSRNETTLKAIARWKDTWVTRTTWTLGIFGVGWTLFNQMILESIKGIFH